MHDRHPFWCTLALCVSLAALLALGCVMCGPEVKNALFAAMKLVVLR